MLKKIWPFFIIISYIYAIFKGNVEQINNSIFNSTSNAVELSITFLGTICLWNGIMKIAQNTSIILNAATPLGIKAMKTMQEENINKDTVSNSMAMFIVLNTASLQLIPTTVIAIRSSLGSSNPTNIIVPVWIATIIAAIVGIISSRIVIKLTDKKK